MNTSSLPSHLHVVSNWLANASSPLGNKAENHEGEPLGPLLLTWKRTNEDVIFLERFTDCLRSLELSDLDEVGSVSSGSALSSELPFPSTPGFFDDWREESLRCRAAEADNDKALVMKPVARGIQREDDSKARTSQRRREDEDERNDQQNESNWDRAGQDGEEEDDYSNPSGTSIAKVSHGRGTRLVCPFYVHDPAKWKDCRTKGSQTMHAITYERDPLLQLSNYADEGSKRTSSWVSFRPDRYASVLPMLQRFRD